MADEIQYSETIKDKAISQPLVEHIYTADPSAHVFDGKIYIYPSHDIDAGIPFNDNGDHFGMEDYHVISLDKPGAVAVDHGVALHVKDVAWAQRQMWAPDAACKNGKYYLYFPAKREDNIFQIGVAVGDSPAGPFKPEPHAIKGSYSIDPAVFADDDGEFYMYFGGIWGGQLQKYRDNAYGEKNEEPSDNEPALGPIVARMTDDMKEFAETPREIEILDENGEPLLAGDHERREPDRDRVREQGPVGRRVRLPIDPRLTAGHTARHGRPHVVERPSAHHRVVEHDRRRHPRDERPHPCVLRPHHLHERPDRPKTREPPHPELDEDERSGPDEEKDDPADEELATAVLRGDAREAPDVARADRHAEHGEQHGEPRGEMLW